MALTQPRLLVTQSRQRLKHQAFMVSLAMWAACTGQVGGNDDSVSGGGRMNPSGGSQPASTDGKPATSNPPPGTSSTPAPAPGGGNLGTDLGAAGGPAAGAGGSVVSAAPNTAPGAVAACETPVTNRRVRRLSRREYANVVTDLLGAPAGATVLSTMPPEPRVQGFDNLDDGFSIVSTSWQSTVADMAAGLAAQADPVKVAPCAAANGSSTCLQTFIRSFAKQAYGRPLTDAEFTRANALAAMGQDYATAVRLVIELVLQSPNLIYLSELGDPAAPPTPKQAVQLTVYEIASQLSFLLSGSRPDATLMKAAEAANGLASTADIQREATRMLTTDRANAELTRFIVGWLDMGPLTEVSKAPTAFPEFTPALVTAMQQEFDQFVATQLNRGNGTIASFMTATSTSFPSALMPIYGTDMTPSGLDPKKRRGVLSLPGLLAFHSSDVNSGPVERGLLIRRHLLCQHIPPAPPNAVMTNPIDVTDIKTTTRQKFSAHVDDPNCAPCHLAFDPIGFGFEQMDGLGRFRTTENGLPVDSRGHLTGTGDVDGPFEGPADLSMKLANSKLAESCMVNHFFSFAQSRPTSTGDSCVLRDWTSKFSGAGGHIKDLVLSYVADGNFVKRKDDR